MAEANSNKAHHIMTYLSILFLPIILSWLLTKLVETSHDLTHQWEWNHVCLSVSHYPRKHRKKKKARGPSKFEGQAQRKKSLMLTYLLPLALISFKVGCRVKHSLRRLQAALNINHYMPKIVTFAASTTLPYQVPRIRFDTNSFVIGIDTFASITLGNHPDQFEDLRTHNNMEVEGIQGGLGIKGTGTFKFHIKDNKGGVHLIKIPNSKYVPDLKVCLLSPHHWAQEAKDHYPVPKGTKTDTNNKALTLIWKLRKHQQTIPYHPLTNTPSFRTAPALRFHRAFVALFEAAEAHYHQQKHVLQMPGQLHLNKEFTPKENVHADIPKKPITDSEGATSNELTVQASNLSSEKGDKKEKETTRMGPCTFDVNPKLEEDKHVYLAAVDNQAKLMRWHYRLGHLSFAKLKQLALNGKIPRRLAKVKPPACAGCLFGAMTKVPWRGQETSLEVFMATKVGQCVSVDQIISTQVGFIAQLKGTLTKKRYTAATVFVNHYSRLKYIHLMTKLTSKETMEAKQVFEHFSKQHGVHILHYHCDNR
jgi:hypothetical protein